MFSGITRGAVGGVAALALLVPAAGVTQAAPAQHGSPSVAAATAGATAARAERTVLKNEFGKAKSRVRGTFGNAGAVTGNFTPRRFKVNQAGELIAIGHVVAKLTKGNGTVLGKVVKRVHIPVASANGAPVARAAAAAATNCRILNLVLGPLNLNLLGLKVTLNRVHLKIVAIPGPGNLLGNLLCAVAGLLDSGVSLDQLSQILSAISQILQL